MKYYDCFYDYSTIIEHGWGDFWNWKFYKTATSNIEKAFYMLSSCTPPFTTLCHRRSYVWK